MGEETSYAEAIKLIEPEQIPTNRINQYSLEQIGLEYQAILKRYDSVRQNLADAGITFGGRVLLIGPPGTDFESFVNFLGREVPLKHAVFRSAGIMEENKSSLDALRVGFEFARRSSPVMIFMERLESIAPQGSNREAVLYEELNRTSWADNEVLVVATTTKVNEIDRELLALFDYSYVIEETSIDDRTRVFEQVLADRKDFDPAILAELTEHWSFADTKRLASSLFLTEIQGEAQPTREEMQNTIEKSGVLPLGTPSTISSISRKLKVGTAPKISEIESDYPDEFLDQLYLMSVGEDYARTQRVVEVLNDGLPLSANDREFLSKHPHLLNGTAEDRLTRLLKAKKSSDRLQRIMGR